MAPSKHRSHHQPERRKQQGHKGRHSHRKNSGAPNHERRPSPSPKTFPLVTRQVQAVALGPSLPPLLITYTNEQRSIEAWLHQHVFPNNKNNMEILGLDTESKPCFTRAAALASKGPDTLQLAKADGNCIVIHLSRMERWNGNPLPKENSDDVDASRLGGYMALSRVLKSKQIAKVGVGIDDDALELHKNHLFETSCRFDLRKVQTVETETSDNNCEGMPTGNDKKQQQPQQQANAQQPMGLKALSEYHVKGMILPKKKHLQMSNWAVALSDAQIGYAAADAFAGAMVVCALEASADSQHTKESLIEMVLAEEVDISLLPAIREQLKRERKREAEKRRQQRKNEKAKNNAKRPNQESSKPGKKKGKGNNNAKRRAPPHPPRRGSSDDHPVYTKLSTSLKSAR